MDHLMRTSGLQGYPALMRSLGCDPIAQLRRYDIDEELLDCNDAMISLRAAVHLLEASATQTACPDFGLRLAQHQNIDSLGPLSIVLQNAPTVRAAMAFGVRYSFIQSPGLVYTVNEHNMAATGLVETSIEIRLSGQPVQRQMMDLCLANIHNFTRLLAGDRYAPRAVSVPHRPIAPLGTYERFFGSKVLVEQPKATLHLSRSTVEGDLRSANPMLRQIAEDYIFRNFGNQQGSVSDRVRQVLRRTLGVPNHGKTGVADLLAMHPRTMQRRLAAESTCFEELRNHVRKELAIGYLRETKLPLAQISLLLGFPTQSALSRACRQWYGTTPSALRFEGGVIFQRT